MTQQEFIKKLEDGYKDNIEISRRKNADYSTGNDAFKNFRASEAFGVPVETAILVRMSDKFARIGNLLKKEGEVKDESIADTLSDLANYAMILKVYLENEKKKDLEERCGYVIVAPTPEHDVGVWCVNPKPCRTHSQVIHS